MQHINGSILFSPTDLTQFVACDHLTQLALAAALGETRRPYFENPYADLIQRKGQEHERQFLESLRAAGAEVVETGRHGGDFAAGAEATRQAMQAGAPYVYQAVLVAGRWRGVADFLARVDHPSALGAWRYEVLDTKLARHPRPEHALQLCAYSEAVAAIQDAAPEHAYVVLGTQERVPIRLANVAAYFRRVRRRLEAAVEERPATLPFPCDHCDVCDFRSVCTERWEREDHLIRVAYIRRDQVERLQAAGLASLAALADAPAATKVPRLRETTFSGLRAQAALQRRSLRAGAIEWEPHPVEDGRGFHRLPPPSPGDVFLDLEGHPFLEPARGLEFLFGVLAADAGGAARYQPLWAHDRAGERRALEAFVDLGHARLAAHPDMHVYHFGGYEPSAIKRLMGEHATREMEVDELLRRQVFVDLLTVFRQAIRAGVSSYSLKELEALGGFRRAATVRSGTDAILAYERWRDTADAAQLAGIAAYNEEDCRATQALREWLYRQRPADLPWPAPIDPHEPTEDSAAAQEERRQLREALIAGAEPGSARWLAGELLEYHRREARPGWWWYYARLAMSPDELVEDAESIGLLAEDPREPPRAANRSRIHTLTFPPQDGKLGREAVDPATGQSAGLIVEIDEGQGILRLQRRPSLSSTPLPRALIPGGPYADRHQRDAVLRVARSVHAGAARYPALEALLARDHPRIRGVAPGGAIQTNDLAAMKTLALGLDGSHLFVQGPPGSGKTWTGARLIVRLLAEGRRVGISAQSHKAIHNLLDEVERVAHADGVRFRGLKKSTGANPESEYHGAFITSEADVKAVVRAGPKVALLAGTAWLFARPELDGQLDTLVIDEAGQVALADALALGTCARNVILLGDPLQLAQVSQGVHPEGSGRSVLEHLLGAAPTIPPDRGLFLERSFRMHPDVCAFISEVVYAGRLRSDASAARRATARGTGIRFLPVAHEGNRAASDEEVARIKAEIGGMLGGPLTEAAGAVRPLVPGDIMVVAPYNAQVRRLLAGLPAGVKVGTVDKFQGQEAPVVFFSMATSSGEDVPHNLAFLFSRNRLNVAISRAQCLALLVCSPRLLEARCRSIEEMELVNALCRLVEFSEGVA